MSPESYRIRLNLWRVQMLQLRVERQFRKLKNLGRDISEIKKHVSKIK